MEWEALDLRFVALRFKIIHSRSEINDARIAFFENFKYLADYAVMRDEFVYNNKQIIIP